jgi:glucosamine-6-phosphate deaminase
MNVHRHPDRIQMARAAAEEAADLIGAAISARGIARILVAASELHVEFFEELVRAPGIAWGNVELFQTSEFVGLAVDHPASARNFVFETLIHPARLGRYHLLDGGSDPERVCRDVGAALAVAPVDVALAELAQDARIAFNEPPADFNSERPYVVVQLDAPGRCQQVEVGRFTTLADVPLQAITVSVRQLLKAKTILCLVAGARMAPTVRRCVEGPVSPLAPASILQTHSDTRLFLEPRAAELLGDPSAG